MRFYLLLFHSCLNCKYFEPSPYDDKYNDLGLCHKHIRILEERPYFEKAEAMRRTENIYNTTLEIFNFADGNNITTQFAAMQIAQNRIDQRKKENTNK